MVGLVIAQVAYKTAAAAGGALVVGLVIAQAACKATVAATGRAPLAGLAIVSETAEGMAIRTTMRTSKIYFRIQEATEVLPSGSTLIPPVSMCAE